MRLGDAFRFNAKPCKTCGARFSVFAKLIGRLTGPFSHDSCQIEIDYFWESTEGKLFKMHEGNRLIYICQCMKGRYASPVIGKYNAGKRCDGRCLAATGFNCECACKGKNHGAGHEAHA